MYKNEIYTTGGENAGNKVWKYNPSSNKWSTFRTLPEKLVAPIARIVDGNLIVAGGGAPRAALAVKTVRSMRVDNNPPTVQPAPTQQPTTPAAEPAPVPVSAPPAQPEPGSNVPEGPTLISMEAEYFDVRSDTSTHEWVHVSHGDSSNDDAMITTPDQGELAASVNNTPMLSYLVNFNFPGKHYIWVRGLGDSDANGTGNSDSIHIGLNGTVATNAFRIDQFPNEWTWSRHTPSNPVASLNVVKAGINMVNIWMREDGLSIDKFIITSDPDFIPTGFGPDVTDGTDNFVPPVSNNDSESDENILDDVVTHEAVVELVSTAEDIAAADSTNSELLESESPDDTVQQFPAALGSPFNIIEHDNAGQDVATTNTIAQSKNSSGGLFGGSASLASVLTLLSLLLLRVGRSRTV